jgi:tRNA(Ile)-lysidine synthase
MSYLKQIEAYITKHNLINQNDAIIIGLSGGPDSVFLLHALVALQQKYNLTLIAAHLNHEWRTEAGDEEKLCRAMAENLDITFVSEKLSRLIPLKKYNGSKEEFARHMRRQFLEEVAREHSAHHIALGHHAQDQQETFFIRLIRGTSLSGLTGMKAKSGLYVRPLLETNKKDIVAWLDENKIVYATDISNESQNYLRNRIRSKVIPALIECDERWNNNFLATVARLQQDDQLLDEIAQTTLNTLLTQSDSGEIFDVKKFVITHAALHHRIVVLWLIRNNVQFPVTQTFFDEIIRFLSHERGGKHALHEKWGLMKKQGMVWVEKER